MPAKNNVSEVRELFLACIRQRTRVSIEKELFILSSAQCVNSDRQWLVVGLSVPVKSACVSIPCQVKFIANKRRFILAIFKTYILHNICVYVGIYLKYISALVFL